MYISFDFFYSIPRRFLAIGAGVAIVGLLFTVAVLAVRADEPLTLTTEVHLGTHASTTSAAIGTLVHANVLVASSTGPTPEGTVDFHLFPNTSCSGTSTIESAVPLIAGVAESSATSTFTTGLSYLVHYNGQGETYPAMDGSCTSVIATAPNTTLTTALSSTTIMVESSVNDTAILGNATASAGGTVNYTVFSNAACTLNARSAGEKTVTNGIVPNSDSLQFNIAGTFYWQAVYSGDAVNAPATSTCTSEILTVLATSTPQGTITVDKVTIPGSATTTFHFNVTGSGYSSFDLTDQAVPNNQSLTPGNYTISEQGLPGWKLTAATCSKNGASTTTYTPGSSLALADGDTVSCTFVNTEATSTPKVGKGHKHDCDRAEDHDDDTTCSCDFSFFDHDNGKHKGWFKNGKLDEKLEKMWEQLGKKEDQLEKLRERTEERVLRQEEKIDELRARLSSRFGLDDDDDDDENDD
jgi:hypothetical protein